MVGFPKFGSNVSFSSSVIMNVPKFCSKQKNPGGQHLCKEFCEIKEVVAKSWVANHIKSIYNDDPGCKTLWPVMIGLDHYYQNF